MPSSPRRVLTPRYALAVAYAVEVHAGQVRKGTTVPYASHLLASSSLVLEAGGDEDLAIAALLHDAAEDHGGERRLAEIQERFGERVAGIVRDCSDSLAPEGEEKRDWETRKLEHLAHLRSVSLDALTVWTADKVHNARAIVTDLLTSGDVAMTRFHAPPERVLWYYEENLAMVEDRQVSEAIVVPLRVAVAMMRQLLQGQPESPEREA
jgi:(p)ppGpp synthase/HD superfamily hydrolase